ncbi:glucose-6-phosphate isomerase [Anaeromyxobacter sp. SG64]|uniref:glucose-6-phosphate isomerase n=1 Tax=Anaeromyxobacter sp. SG64 TaxID=2925409 RepID=UPI001F55DF27|nr:glucose-6-phosphate isomerase [Anaeromyxobacter sp. SG64]
MDRLSLDVNGCFDAAADGLGANALDALAPAAAAAFDGFEARRRSGELGFADLPRDAATADASAALARDLAARFENLVVLGIGGSSLGGRAILSALTHPFHNLLPRDRRGAMRVFFPDNSDPATFEALLGTLELEETCFATITKSGGTAETMAQHLVLRERCIARFGEEGYRSRCVLVTDPAKGALRAIADAEGLRALPVPASVGGRFSALSAVGLLPAAAGGVDLTALLAGAAAMEARCRSGALRENPALLYAGVLHLMDRQKGRRIHVLMPYADGLRDTGDWFVQLWAESLGKRPEVGPTPFRAVGATDQHSSMQLMMEGPHDKVVTFVRVVQPRADVSIPVPDTYRPHGEIAYLDGHTMGELIEAERRATEAALRKAGRPTVSIQLPRLDARAMGELLMLLELATAYAGGLYGVNAFDQPGVEAGKRYAQGLLGRPGYEQARDELLARAHTDPALVLG